MTMNESTLRNLTPSEIESHLYLLDPETRLITEVLDNAHQVEIEELEEAHRNDAEDRENDGYLMGESDANDQAKQAFREVSKLIHHKRFAEATKLIEYYADQGVT